MGREAMVKECPEMHGHDGVQHDVRCSLYRNLFVMVEEWIAEAQRLVDAR